jgi:hypothetical protein
MKAMLAPVGLNELGFVAIVQVSLDFCIKRDFCRKGQFEPYRIIEAR